MARVNIVDAQLDRLLNQPSGEVGRYLERKGSEILTIARSRAGVRTGRLKASLHKRHLRDARGQYMWVGSEVPYAYYHHEGTKPRIITPRDSKFLKFTSRGRVVYTHVVNHPGTRANRYLSDALKMTI